jgi:hypothetical protein
VRAPQAKVQTVARSISGRARLCSATELIGIEKEGTVQYRRADQFFASMHGADLLPKAGRLVILCLFLGLCKLTFFEDRFCEYALVNNLCFSGAPSHCWLALVAGNVCASIMLLRRFCRKFLSMEATSRENDAAHAARA